jgi:hypothetical protein
LFGNRFNRGWGRDAVGNRRADSGPQLPAHVERCEECLGFVPLWKVDASVRTALGTGLNVRVVGRLLRDKQFQRSIHPLRIVRATSPRRRGVDVGSVCTFVDW